MQPPEPKRATDSSAIAWSCVLDDTPTLWTHFLVWAATLIECAGVSPEAVVVHHVTDLRPDIAELVTSLGLRTQRLARFDPRSPHSNKISQCGTDFGGANRVVLTDVDLAFVTRPPIEHVRASIAGKPVDFPNPPLEVLSTLFRVAGLAQPAEAVAASFLNEAGALQVFQTFPANYNGGLYVIDALILAELGSAWAHWARWLLDGNRVPARYAVHVDQIAFCMAVHALGVDTEVLDIAWNLPSHAYTPRGDAPPFIVHHHGRLDSGLRLLPLQPSRHQASIDAANAAISSFLRRHDIGPGSTSQV